MVGHLTIADNVKIGAQSGVTNNIKNEGAIVLGSPASDFREAKKSLIIIRKLPELYEKIIAFEKDIEQIKKKIGE